MKRFSITILAAAALAVAPAAAGAQQSGQKIPEPGPILTRIGHTPMVELWDGGGGLPYLGSDAPYNAGDWENALREYHDSGVYEQQIAKVDALASRWLKWAPSYKRFAFKHKRGKFVRMARHGHGRHRGHGPRPHGPRGHGHHGKKLAIVFDIDETVLSNYTAIEADDFTYDENSQHQAENQIGQAIAPSKELYDLAHSKSIAVFYITGRPEDERQDTDENLDREGLGEYEQLYLEPADFTGTTVDYKSGARADIERQGYRIIASVGDQYSDLAGGHEDVAFKLPNPFYFLP